MDYPYRMLRDIAVYQGNGVQVLEMAKPIISSEFRLRAQN